MSTKTIKHYLLLIIDLVSILSAFEIQKLRIYGYLSLINYYKI
jgi:hypothetical protein